MKKIEQGEEISAHWKAHPNFVVETFQEKFGRRLDPEDMERFFLESFHVTKPGKDLAGIFLDKITDDISDNNLREFSSDEVQFLFKARKRFHFVKHNFLKVFPNGDPNSLGQRLDIKEVPISSQSGQESAAFLQDFYRIVTKRLNSNQKVVFDYVIWPFGDIKNMAQIGRELDLSRERIRQLREEVLGKIRSLACRNILKL